jgi:hypothetical protein
MHFMDVSLVDDLSRRRFILRVHLKEENITIKVSISFST